MRPDPKMTGILLRGVVGKFVLSVSENKLFDFILKINFFTRFFIV